MPKILISRDGTLTMIYDDRLVGLMNQGKVETQRASHVEPNENGEWVADMSPIQPGVVLGPFKLRRTALEEEVKWLEKHLFGKEAV